MKQEVEVTGAIKIADKLDIIELLVRQVSALVATTAHVVEVSSKDTFAIEAWWYRNLEVNCRQKANLAEEAGFGSKQPADHLWTNVCARVRDAAGPTGAAAQTRMVSVARIRLVSRKSARLFKGIICNDISEFESHMPSQLVWSPPPFTGGPPKSPRIGPIPRIGPVSVSRIRRRMRR